MLSLSALARLGDNIDLSEPHWLREAVVMINQRAAEPLSLNTVATAVGVHRATLAAAFRRFKNTSVGEFIRAERMRHVMRELKSSKMPLCDIATKCGFYDQAHMGRVFRRSVGISPGVYRIAQH
jgi:AraC family transcriptional regulator